MTSHLNVRNVKQLEMNLFNEAEATAVPETEPEKEAITYKRRKTSGKRDADLSKLPVETVTYRVAEGKQFCGCCGGSLHEMTTETRREIVVVPPQVKVVQHVQQCMRVGTVSAMNCIRRL
ncbi:hypothetical protein HFN20_08290 [Paenibacillus dendritiformis]|nr:hypothetical protein [Paenibacillus dendritiformis]NRF98630.1 IS66 family transposase zinc-finger binding domain-containing protein [Paenibacillus dendritiformis]